MVVYENDIIILYKLIMFLFVSENYLLLRLMSDV